MDIDIVRPAGRRLTLFALTLLWSVSATAGCARLPYTTKTVHSDSRVVTTVQREVKARSYTHPVQLTAVDIASVLKGLSVREQQRLPLRWFAEETPPKPVFRDDEIQALAPTLADAMKQLGTNERAHFELRAPGMNPAASRDTLAGWMAVRESYLYIGLEYFHVQIPAQSSDLYDQNYPTPPPPPRDYILYFEPGRFWVTDDQGQRAIDYRKFLASAEAGASPSRPAAPVVP